MRPTGSCRSYAPSRCRKTIPFSCFFPFTQDFHIIILMKSFFFAETQLDTLPDKILFYNGGAKLTVEGSDCLEDIRILEKEGVEILTCGTCLDFYGLKEKLAVGAVTNMYTIAEILQNAVSVVSP